MSERIYPTPWARAIGRRLEAWGWSQTTMAVHLDEAPQRVNDWIRGRSEPSDAVKPKIIARLGIRADEVAPEWLRDLVSLNSSLPSAPVVDGVRRPA